MKLERRKTNPLSAAVRDAVLESNRQAREGMILTRHAPFAEHMCRIPTDPDTLAEIERRFPGFNGTQGTAAHDQALKDFHASPFSSLYDVRKRGLRHTQNRPRGIIIRPPAAKPGEDLS